MADLAFSFSPSDLKPGCVGHTAPPASIAGHYFAVPPTQTLLILLTIPEDELFAGDDDD